jgi:foldase protein PrsA
MDTGSRAIGGLLAEPITRHAYPQTVSDAAFKQLVDGDPKDPRGPKPKDGNFSGPIQVADSTWVILQREGVIPAQTGISLKDEKVRKQCYDMIYEVKLKEEMNKVFVELMNASKIENKLTGHVKEANEDQKYVGQVDGDVKLMGNEARQGEPAGRASNAPTGDAGLNVPAPVAAPEDDVFSKQTEALKKAPLPKK